MICNNIVFCAQILCSVPDERRRDVRRVHAGSLVGGGAPGNDGAADAERGRCALEQSDECGYQHATDGDGAGRKPESAVHRFDVEPPHNDAIKCI